MRRYSSGHLHWIEMENFAPGLWTNNDLAMPPTAAQIMTDCEAAPAGGIRAAFVPTEFPMTGFTGAGNQVVIGCYVRPTPQGILDYRDFYVWTYHYTERRIRVWRYDETASSPTWAAIKTDHSTGPVNTYPHPVIPTQFQQSDGSIRIVYNHNYPDATAHQGVWVINPATNTFSHVLNIPLPFVTATLNTLCFTVSSFTLRWSANQNCTSWPTANSVVVQGSRPGNQIVAMSMTAPNDILMGTLYGPWTLAQGNLSVIGQGYIRTMSDFGALGWAQTVADTPAGIAYIGIKSGVYATRAGTEHTLLSTGIDPRIWTTSGRAARRSGGNVSFCDPYLLAPRGYCFDFRTQAWHQKSGLTKSFIIAADRYNRRFFTAQPGDDDNDGTNFQFVEVGVSDNVGSQRASSWQWRSAPLLAEDNRRYPIREVQISARGFVAGSTISVTTRSGVSRTATIGNERAVLRFLFPRSVAREVQWITVDAASNTAGVEAPLVETIRIGVNKGNEPD